MICLLLLFPPAQALAYQDQGGSPDEGRRLVDLTSAFPYYSPNHLVVEAGTTVVWRNADSSNMHSVNAFNGAFRSPEITDKEWSFQFRQPGTYEYACRFHPWMRGRVVVQDRRLEGFSVHELPEEWGAAELLGVDGQSNAWFALGQGNPAAPGRLEHAERVVRIDGQGRQTDFQLPALSGRPPRMAVSSRGDVWFLERTAQSLCRLDSSSGRIAKYPIFAAPGMSVAGIGIDAQGRIWLSLPEENQLAAFDTGSMTVHRYDLPEPDSFPGLLVPASGGRVYFAARGGSRLGAFGPSEGEYKEYALSGESRITGLAADQEGTVWYADYRGNQIGRLREDWITEYTLPTPFSGPFDLAAGGGAVWVSQLLANKISVFKDGHFLEYALGKESTPLRLAVDSAGNVWFSQWDSRRVGRIPNASRLYPSGPHQDKDRGH